MPHFRLSPWVPALLALTSFSGCGYGDHDRYDDAPVDPPPSDVVEEATIDTDRLLEVEPGTGAGAFFEYESGGTYHVTTSCDLSSGPECVWDIVIMPLDEAPLLSFAPFDLENDDSLSFGFGNQLQLIAYTGKDFDGFSFQVDPGVPVQVDALLDEGAGNRYLFWIGDGALHQGAPSNPVNLVPSED